MKLVETKRIIPALSLLLVTMLSCDSNPVRPVEYGEGDDYEIYRTVLSRDFDSVDVLILLYDSTVTTVITPDTSRLNYFRQCLPELSDEMLADFISTNSPAAQLDYIEGLKHLVLSRDFGEGSAEHAVRVSLSGVGYDSSKTRAIVEVGELWAPLAGSGALILLSKENGKWKIKNGCMTWIS